MNTKAIVVLGLALAASSATGSRGPFTGEGRRLTEGRIFAMDTRDLDGDGRPDIVVSDFLNPARVLWNDAGRSFSRVVTLTATAETATEGHGVAIADFNGDRTADLFLVYNGHPSRLLFGNGKGGFSDSGRAIGEPGLNGTSVTAADVDGDGDLDALVSHFQQADLIYLNDGKGTFTVSPQALEGNATLGDLDGDGDPDAVCVPGGGVGPASIWLNTKGHFARQAATLDVGEGIASLALADFDGDRALDLVVLGRTAKTTLWKNDGRGGFQKLDQVLESGTRMAAGDIDLDGDPDLVVGNVVWLNSGGGRFENVQTLDLGDLPTAVHLTDVDNDGDLDLLANRGSRETGRTTLLLFENTLRQASGSGPLTTTRPVVAEIPIEVERNRTILPVTVGGRTLRLILDTGQASDGILIFDRDKIAPDALGPSFAATVEGAGSGPGSNARVFERARFEVGAVAFANQRAIVLADNAFKGFPTDGVIGYSLLGHYAVEIDYDRGVMRLYDADTFAARPGWESLPIYFKDNRIPWLDITIATADEPPVRLATYIDFASGEALELLTRDTNRFTLPAGMKERYLGRGFSGDIYGQEGTIARMRLGSHELTGVAVAIAPAAVRSKQEGADAVVGNNALRRFNVIFDYAHRELHIRPNSHFSEPFHANR